MHGKSDGAAAVRCKPPLEEPCMFRIATGARISATLLVGAAWLLLVLTATLAAAPPEHPEAVHFKPGATSSVLRGKLTGWDMKEYALRASKGQTLKLQVTSRRINWLIVRLYPASQSSGDNDLLSSDNSNTFQWEGPLPADGEYVLRLFIRRTEARRGGSVDYRVRLAIFPK